MTLRLNGSTSGYTELDAPATAGNNTISLPASNGAANQFLKNGATAGTLGWSNTVEDSSGRLLVGTTASYTVGATVGASLQLFVTNSSIPASFTRYTNDNNGPVISLGKSRGTSVDSFTVVQSGDTIGDIRFAGADGTDLITQAASISCEVDGTPGANDMPGRLVFSTTADGASSPVERMRIAQNGTVTINSDGSTPNASTSGFSFIGSGVQIAYSSASGAGSRVFEFGGNAGYARIMGDGDLENTNNRYTGISDIKLKQNIEDASSQWDDFKAIQVRKYELIAHPERKHIGVIAQELEQVCPGLVVERIQDEETGETVKSVAYSVLYMKAVKALQEAMERIETLEAKVAALEAN